MEVIMLKDVAKVGRKHEIATVSEGYAINYLIPKGLAKAATAGAKKELEMKKGKEGAAKSNEAAKVVEGIKTVDGKSVTIHAKVNEKGHLFAALHKEKINEAIFNQTGVTLPDDVLGDVAIKEIGTFDISLAGEGTRGSLKLFVEHEG
jgi:large subunit ribosomal protein L9